MGLDRQAGRRDSAPPASDPHCSALVNDDWFDLLQALIAAEARFLVVGAHAMAVHGVPRGTHDLDVWIEPAHDNAKRVWDALLAFGAPVSALGVSLNDFVQPGIVVQIGVPPNRIDVLTAISGVPDFGAAWQDRSEHAVRRVPIPFLGRAALVANKRASGRRKDQADLEALGEMPPLE